MNTDGLSQFTLPCMNLNGHMGALPFAYIWNCKLRQH